MARPERLLLTCEHGGNRVPRAYDELFAGHEGLLDTHRGLDVGALEAARHLRRVTGAPLIYAQVTRMLVDLNRSERHPRRYSELTRDLPDGVKRRIHERYYRPYRVKTEQWIDHCAAAGARAVHVSVHSFTDRLDGAPRRCDVGLLYDPRRSREKALADCWQRALKAARPDLVVRRNYPYKGVSDGLVTYLRKGFDDARYAGIELELNQRWAEEGGSPWRGLLAAVAASLAASLALSGAGSAGEG